MYLDMLSAYRREGKELGKIIEVCFQSEDGYYKRVSEPRLVQWSYGHILRIIGLDLPDPVEIHFSLDERHGEAPAQIGRTVDGVTEVEIPAFIMEGPVYIANDYYKAYAFIYVSDKDFGETVRKIEFNIRVRPKPTNSVPEPQQDEFLNEVRAIMQETKDVAQSVRDDADNGAFIGPPGPAGKTAFQYAQDGGFAGTEEDFMQSLARARDIVTKAEHEDALLKAMIKPTTDPATSLHIQDSSRYRVLDVSMSGKTEQKTTTGKNVFDLSKVKINNSATTGLEVALNDTGIRLKNAWAQEIVTNENVLQIFEPNTKYICTAKVKVINKPSVNLNSSINVLYLYDNINTNVNSTDVIKINEKNELANGQIVEYTGSFVTKDLSDVKLYAYCYYDADAKKAVGEFEITDLMVRKAEITDATYEPYTGGAASPNPNYPQEIEHAGTYNEETGRYEVDVKISNKNLHDYVLQDVPNLNSEKDTYRSIEFDLPQGSYVISFSEDIYMQKDSGCVVGGGTKTFFVLNLTGSDDYIQFRRGNWEDWDDNIEIQIEKGTTTTPYIPHQAQHITLTSSRELTKWDRLVKKDGWYHWAFKSIKYVLDGSMWLRYDNFKGFSLSNILNETSDRREGYCNQAKVVTPNMPLTPINGLWLGVNNKALYLVNNGFYDDSLEDKGLANFKAHLNENPLEIWTYSDTAEYIPVSDEEQAALEALETYYGVTNITNSEECMMQIQYVVDTKLYVDSKILEIQSAVI